MNSTEKLLYYFNQKTGNINELSGIVKIHFELLKKWQRIANLIGLTDERDIADFLYLDSYLVLKNISQFLIDEKILINEISDIGSGAGFPSLFWSYFLPDTKVILYEPKRKRANFLRDFIRIAELDNFQVKEEMVEKESIKTHLIISRAAININDWPRFGISNLVSGGVCISLINEESHSTYKRSIEKIGRILKSMTIKYILPYSLKRRVIGIIIRK